MLRIFTPVKIQRIRPDLNPQNWVPEASMLTTRPPKPTYPKIHFNSNPSNGSRVVPCGRTDGQTDMRKLIFAFHNFAKASKINESLMYVKE